VSEELMPVSEHEASRKAAEGRQLALEAEAERLREAATALIEGLAKQFPEVRDLPEYAALRATRGEE